MRTNRILSIRRTLLLALILGLGLVMVAAIAASAASGDEAHARRQAAAASPTASDNPRLTSTNLEPSHDWLRVGMNDGDHFGFAVAGAGDINGDGFADLLVGAYAYPSGGEMGQVYVYTGTASGLGYSEDAVLDGENNGDQFGYALDGAGDVNGDGYADVIVGAWSYGADRGRAYVYYGSKDGLPTTPATVLNGEGNGDFFGGSVAGLGDINWDGYADVIVGADGYGGGRGRAYVYHGSKDGLATTPARTLEGESGGDSFGYAVAGAGDVNGDGYLDAIVGAYGYDKAANQGRAYIFHGSAGGLNATPARTLSGQGDGDYFGSAVDGAGDVNGDGYADVIVGADVFNSGTKRGRAYVYHGSASGVSATVSFTSTGENQNDGLAWSVAGAGDVNGDGYGDAIVGAYGYPSVIGWGRAYVHLGSAAGLAASPGMTVTGYNSGDQFGIDVAGAGDVNGDGYADVAVGAWRAVEGSNRGAAYVYHGQAAGLSASPTATFTSDDPEYRLGRAVAMAGLDVNGDGYGDALAGSWGSLSAGLAGRAEADHAPAAVIAGRVNVYYGSAAGLSPASVLTPPAGLVGYGHGLASAGDLNGDGYSDAMVTALDAQDTPMVYVYHGSAAGLLATPAVTLTGEPSLHGFDWNLDGAGDVNGDGYGDAILGNSDHDGGRGRVYLFHGSASGLPTTPALTLTGGNEGSSEGGAFGGAVAGAGDVNGDGYADVIVGAASDSGFAGRAYVYHGSAAGLSSTPALTLTGEASNDTLGAAVAAAGDINGDGYGDVIIGAPIYPGGAERGRAYIHLGSAAGLNPVPALVLTGENDLDRFGRTVEGAGDLNGDGLADFLVSAVAYNGDLGRVYVYHGHPSSLSSTPALTLTGSYPMDQLGLEAAGGGDVNGDGYADVIFGTPNYTGTASYGRVHVHHGNTGSGRQVRALQQRGDGRLVQPWGLAGADGAFQVQMTATSPQGRERVKLQVEACPPGKPFGAVECLSRTSAQWTDSTAASRGVTLTLLIDGFDEEALYRWRARVLHAPMSVDQPIVAAPNPAHGPWRRFHAQGVEADVRVQPDLRHRVYLPLVIR